MQKIKNFIKKNALTKKQYIFLAILILLITLLETAYPIKQINDFYTYEFGILYPWIYCFNNLDLGGMTLFQCIIAKNSLGVSIYPQNILISVIFINIIIAFIRWVSSTK